MMEPVAPANDRQIELMKDFWAHYGSPPYKREFDARLLKKDFLSLIVRLSDAEARIKELEKKVDDQIWEMAEEAERTSIQKARAEAAEALLKEARKALEPFAEFVDQEDQNYPDTFSPKNDHREVSNASFDYLPLRGWFRAARAVYHKIGVKDE